MKKLKVLGQLAEAGVVAVLRADSPEEVAEMARRAIKGGIKAIEITMTVPFALRAIEQLSKEYSSTASPDSDNFAIIGVGTVLDPRQLAPLFWPVRNLLWHLLLTRIRLSFATVMRFR